MAIFQNGIVSRPAGLDFVPDTFSPLDKDSNITLSNGNLTATWASSANRGVRSLHAIRDGQKLYCEITCSTVNGSYGVIPTVAHRSLPTDGSVSWTQTSGVCGWRKDGTFSFFGGTMTAEASYTSGTIIGFAVSRSGSTVKVYVHKDGTYVIGGDSSGTPNPATAANPNGTYTIGSAIHMGCGQRDGTSVVTANFGASAFSHAVPTGFTAGWGAATGTPQLIPQTTGTAIGTMTAYGDLAGAFDGTVNKPLSPDSSGVDGVVTGFIGKDWGAGVTKTITGVKTWAPNDLGYMDANSQGVTLTLWGHSSNDPTAATSLGTIAAITDSAATNAQVKLSGFTTTTAYRYHWVGVRRDSGVASFRAMAQCQFYETT